MLDDQGEVFLHPRVAFVNDQVDRIGRDFRVGVGGLEGGDAVIHFGQPFIEASRGFLVQRGEAADDAFLAGGERERGVRYQEHRRRNQRQ